MASTIHCLPHSNATTDAKFLTEADVPHLPHSVPHFGAGVSSVSQSSQKTRHIFSRLENDLLFAITLVFLISITVENHVIASLLPSRFHADAQTFIYAS